MSIGRRRIYGCPATSCFYNPLVGHLKFRILCERGIASLTERHSLRLCIWGPDGFAISSARSGTVDQLSVACPEAWVRGSLELLETTSRSSQHCEEHAPCVSTSTRGAAPGPKSLSNTMPIGFNKSWAFLRQQSPSVSALPRASAVTALERRSIGHWAAARLRALCDVLILQPLGRAFEISNSLRGWHRIVDRAS